MHAKGNRVRLWILSLLMGAMVLAAVNAYANEDAAAQKMATEQPDPLSRA